MIAYAIKHKPSGNYLPATKRRAGFTHDVPVAGIPRLFRLKGHAKVALKCWLQGEWEQVTSYSGGSMYGDDYDVYPEPPKNPPADRKAEDMEIVAVEVREVRELIP